MLEKCVTYYSRMIQVDVNLKDIEGTFQTSKRKYKLPSNCKIQLLNNNFKRLSKRNPGKDSAAVDGPCTDPASTTPSVSGRSTETQTTIKRKGSTSMIHSWFTYFSISFRLPTGTSLISFDNKFLCYQVSFFFLSDVICPIK